MAGASAGVVGQAELNTNNPGRFGSKPKSPALWSWVWFIVAVAIVLGFHVRIFGVTVPPIATAP